MPSASKILAGLLIAAVAIGLMVGAAHWLGGAAQPSAGHDVTQTAADARPSAPADEPNQPHSPADVAASAPGDVSAHHTANTGTDDEARELSDARLRDSEPLGSLDGLDEAPPSEVEDRLVRAIARARETRGAFIAEGLVEQLLERGEVRVIVAKPRARETLTPPLVGSRHGEPRFYHSIPYAALAVGPQALLTLIESGDVSAIERDSLHAPSLDESVPIIGADLAVDAGYDGGEWVIAVLDTGVQTDHPFFADRLVDGACFSNDSDCPNGEKTMYGIEAGQSCDFSCDHGTYVAGAAAGYDDAQPLSGVAPGASLISIQIFSEVDPGKPRAYTSDIIAALDHVHGLRFSYSIAAVNLSLGGDLYASAAECDADNGARKAMVDELRRAGIATVASSGNDSLTDLITAPACISNVIAVGATEDDDDVAPFSNSSNDVDLLAPGRFIRTSIPGSRFGDRSGTSLAAPHVAGAFALILSASPTSSVEDILHALEVTGVPVRDDRNEVTKPRIEVMDAIAFLLDGGSSGPPEEPTTDDASASGAPSDDCGLVGLELLLPLLLVRSGLRRRRTS